MDMKLQENINSKKSSGSENPSLGQDLNTEKELKGGPNQANSNLPHKKNVEWSLFNELVLEDLQRKGKKDSAENLKLLEEQISLSKAKPKAEIRRLIEKPSSSLFSREKPYPEWSEFHSRKNIRDQTFLSSKEPVRQNNTCGISQWG